MLLPLNTSIQNLTDLIAKQEKTSAPIRILEILNNKIYRVFSPQATIQSISESTIFAEEIDPSELQLSPPDSFLIRVAHMTPVNFHIFFFVFFASHDLFLCFRNLFGGILGIHFYFQYTRYFFFKMQKKKKIKLFQDDTLKDIKAKISSKLGVSMEELNKWKMQFVSGFRVEPIKDGKNFFFFFFVCNLFQFVKDENIVQRFTQSPGNFYNDPYLGIEHESSTKTPRRTEKGISING